MLAPKKRSKSLVRTIQIKRIINNSKALISTSVCLGWWSVAMFTVLLLHLLPVLLYTGLTWRRLPQSASYLLAVPSLLLLLASLGILLPTAGKYIETALEIVIRKV